jgi:hypothetical protein
MRLHDPRIAAALIAAITSGLFSALAACAPPAPAPDVPASLQHIAEVHKALCGNCHVRVEPGGRTHAELTDAFQRHRSRVHLTDEEWSEMIEYLQRTDGQRQARAN